jgi:hypothetical protein
MQVTSGQPNYSHDRLQSECGKYLWNQYPQTRKTFFHPANETKREKGETKHEYIVRLSQRKAIWVLPGCWDLLFFWNKCLYCFDIKIGNDRLSNEQLDFKAAIERQGGKCYEINDLQQFKDIVAEILK